MTASLTGIALWQTKLVSVENDYLKIDKYVIICMKPRLVVSKHIRRRRRARQEDLKIVEDDTKEILIEKFLLLRDAYDELKDEKTNLEYEVESLKDDTGDLEEEVDTHLLIAYPQPLQPHGSVPRLN